MVSKADLKKRIDRAFEAAEKDAIDGKYTPKRAKAVRENMSGEIDIAIQGVLRGYFGKNACDGGAK